ncbi:class I SAM-dependent methyltransferase [Marivibrio halodurans]|uniref:Class I SAM-dependent methyltransferase n=1 Tax=Marivibrio halodurans TaxID=2039722 RepID=A0A8J7S2R0_9PROT|nr:class I SAM-dependent methyltransferase [Marivibrio halodurans]MBP5855624.1 class I SAM-dependent methyltransferase [Marivibrio halodurans]
MREGKQQQERPETTVGMIETREVDCVLCGTSEVGEEVCVTKDFCYETCENEFHYVACANCGHLYLKNRPALSELSTIYPKNYLTYDYEKSLGNLIFRLRNAVQARKIDPIAHYARPNDTIVDIGCGAGDLLRLMRRYGAPGWRLVGVDFSAEAVKRARADDIEVIEGRIEALPENTLNDVGVFVMNQLIEHVEDPGEVLRSCASMLRPGGVLIMETPNHAAWDPRLFRSRYWGCWHAPRHWNIFDAESLGSLAERNGFEVVAEDYTLNPFGWLHSIQYWMRERVGWWRLGRKFDVDNVFALAAASALDVLQKLFSGKTSNLRLICRRPEMER